jgi:hypothetical protein
MGLLDPIARALGYAPKNNRRVALGRVRSYGAAAVNRLTADWNIQNVSPDTDLFRDLRIMRARSRQLAKNDPYFGQFIRLVRKNVVGAQGFRLNVRSVNGFKPDGTVIYDEPANRAMEMGFEEFSKKKNFTTAKTITRAEFERLVVGTVAIDGEAFIRRAKGFPGNAFRYALQLIPADCLDERLNTTLPGGNYIRLGVEKNQWDQPVAYHLRRQNPVDFVAGNGTEYMVPTERIDASEIIHLFVQEAPQQTRGVPWLYAAMAKLNMLGAYEEAELVAARVASCKLGFITNDEATEYDGDGYAADGSQFDNSEPGQFKQLAKGQKVQSWDPNHPNAAFAEFHRAMMRGVAMAGGVAHHSITGDLSQVNYSSARIGLLDERDSYLMLQSWFKDHCADDVFEDFLTMAITTGQVALPMAKFDKFNKPTWRGRRWSWVDPQKEVAAYAAAVKEGFTSRTAVIEQMNGEESFEDIVAELKVEKAMMEDAGVYPDDLSPMASQEPDGDEPAPSQKPQVGN